MDRLFHVQQRIDAAKARGGWSASCKQAWPRRAGAATFARLYLLPGEAPRPAGAGARGAGW
jgi:magnesium-protoporphyrin IX monomethyl ester (oxidative) cyclase